MIDRLSPDELFVFGVSLLLGLGLWTAWYWKSLTLLKPFGRTRGRSLLHATPPVCAALLLLILRGFAADDVRDDPLYLWAYMAMGAGWLAVGKAFLPLVGLSARDDVLERGNGASAQAIGGALIALTLCFAGANMGNGPGWWVVVFSAVLSTAGLFLAWTLVAQGAGLGEAIRVERDPAAGWRAAGFLVGCSLILGRAVAGDWVSAGATVADFLRQAWPAAGLVAVASVAEPRYRPSTDRDVFSTCTLGVLPGLGYVLLGLIVPLYLGLW